MSASMLINQVITGLSIASIYVLFSIGLTIIFGLMNILNFAHGVIYTLGAYCGYEIARSTGSFWLALLIAPVIVAGVGLVIDYLCVRPLWHRGHLIQFLATFALALIIEQLIRIVMGNGAYAIAVPPALRGTLLLGPVKVASYRVFLVGVAIIVIVATGLALTRTRWGAVIRATTEDSVMAGLLKVDTRRVLSVVFALGCALAALGGVLAAPVFSVYPSMGNDVIAGAFLVVVVGGMGSITGTILASLIVGETLSLGVLWVGSFADVAMLAVMGLLLVLKPLGLTPLKGKGNA